MPLLDTLCGSHGVGPVCHELNIAPSTYYRHQNYRQHPEARSDIFDYIEMFYNSRRRHGSSVQMSPTEYENQYYQRLRSV